MREREHLDSYSGNNWVAVDTETTGLDPWHGDRPFAFSFCWPLGRTLFARWSVDPKTREVQQQPSSYNWMKMYLGNPSVDKVFFNHKFDVRMFESIGIEVKGTIHDAMFSAHVLNTLEPSFGLKRLAMKYLEMGDDDEKELQASTLKGRREAKKAGYKIATKETHGKKPVKADYWLADLKTLRTYAIQDAERTAMLWRLHLSLFEEEPKLWKVYQEEMRLAPITYRMETRGLRVNPGEIEKQRIFNFKRARRFKAKILRLKPGLNINSGPQLTKLIYGDLKCPVKHRTDGGAPSVNSEALGEIKHPVVKDIQEFRAAEKANSTFFERYKRAMVLTGPSLWVLHPDFIQVGPVTARYACKNPNMQNVANALTTRSSVPIQARTPFIPRNGYWWWHFDYTQLEMWIFAALAKETKMLDALFSGRDLHGETAEHVWGKGIVAREATVGKKTARAKAKMMNFGIIYGIGASSLASLTNSSYRQAQQDIEAYMTAFPNIKAYMENTIRFARNRGYVEGPMGRRWGVLVDRAYVAVNYTVQGSAAQVIKRAMFDVDRFFSDAKLDAHIIATIHDEHVDEIIHKHANPTVIKKIKSISEQYGNYFGLPKLPVDVDVTKTNWKEKEKYQWK